MKQGKHSPTILQPGITGNDSAASIRDVESERQWRDNRARPFFKSQRSHTTILFGGLTLLQDSLIEETLASMGYKVKALECPDSHAFQLGKEYGNRGQCNPTYFTVGNLVKYLTRLRDEQHLSNRQIVDNYVYLTAGGCGPCRFGMYVTEYRKALRDAGFDGFRILNFDHSKGIYQGDGEQAAGLEFTPTFFIQLARAILIGDILNILGYRLRPYETSVGATDAALNECKAIMAQTIRHKRSIILGLRRCRNIMRRVPIDRSSIKPKVHVMGEFWASLTEGDGNYQLKRFLEQEGAECVSQPVVNRLLLNIWEAGFNHKAHAHLPDTEFTGKYQWDFSNLKTRFLIALARTAVITHFNLYATAIGLHNYQLPDMRALAKRSKDYYPHQSQGGEGHLEVAHLIDAIEHRHAHLVLSVKPFGCMPSSGVSDGIQSLITAKYPHANFLAVETSGDGAVNFLSRVQMALYRAKQQAQQEIDDILARKGITESDMNRHLNEWKKTNNYLFHPHKHAISTAANLVTSCKT